MQLNKNFEINPDITDVPSFLDDMAGNDCWDITWRRISDACGKTLRYDVTSGRSVYQVHDLADCLSMVMTNVKWLAECLDYGYVREVKNEA